MHLGRRLMIVELGLCSRVARFLSVVSRLGACCMT